MTQGDQIWAVEALQALGHETRLSVFRMLVKAGPPGLMAGKIAQSCGVPPSTMSHHLANLERAGLATSQRESRVIRYRADYAGMRSLLGFLMEDCCQGDPRLCADFSEIAGCVEGEPAHATSGRADRYGVSDRTVCDAAEVRRTGNED
jgi:ArsR family transcriptional regulator, arsenate/arsenite/antimonite-responsive transcriptional repressor